MTQQPEDILKQYWGYESFRGQQKRIILDALANKDVLGLLPTGGGKSVCYQIPGLLRPGITIVISPLLALMNDQVIRLKQLGIKAEFINGGMSPKQMDYALDNCVYGKTKFLYLSPERIQSVFVKERIKQMKVNFIAIDEAHCISQWGHDFRPAFRSVRSLRDLLPGIPVIAVTATATKKVANDIQLQLDFLKQNVVKDSSKRTNIYFESIHTENKIPAVTQFMRESKGCGIVYIRSRKLCEQVASQLNKEHVSAEYYHAGIELEERKQIEARWKNDKTRIIVATNAFGMGIDKPDVKLVVHFGLPNSLEEYYQEAGRAGRDGKAAKAVLFFNRNDIQSQRSLLNYRFPSREIIRNVYQAIGNLSQVAIGAGENEGAQLDLKVFSKKHNLHPLTVHYAVKVLENAGYIFLSEDVTSGSKLKILQERKEIENILSNIGFQAKLLSAILRSYTGIFSDYVKISESTLASVLETSVDKVKKGIEILERTFVVDYQAQSFLPRVFFASHRISSKDLIIPKEILETRQRVAEEQLGAMVNFAIEKKKCRTNIALFYFDETPISKCGNCDNCLIKLELSPENHILKLLNNAPLELPQVVHQSELPRNETIAIIRDLMENGKIIRDELLLRLKKD